MRSGRRPLSAVEPEKSSQAEQDRIVGKVLNAAALTYVAAAITAILQLLYYLSLVSRRSD